jgi:hypothetical protein
MFVSMFIEDFDSDGDVLCLLRSLEASGNRAITRGWWAQWWALFVRLGYKPNAPNCTWYCRRSVPGGLAPYDETLEVPMDVAVAASSNV